CRSRLPGRGGSACPAGGGGSSPPSRPGRRRASRRASSAWSRGRSATSRVPFCVPLLLLLECRFERRERALPRLAGALLLERGLDLLAAPAGSCPGDLRNRHLVDVRPGCGRLGLGGGLLLGLRLRIGLRELRPADRLD